ncbi:MAG TPA: TAXI family TRAP transporter solute-binding subunit [Acidobacteriaceae bacterium]
MQGRRAFAERPALWLYLTAGALILVATAVTVAWLGPLPPKVVVMSTGTEGGTYDVFAQQYKVILARSGVVLRLVPSAGGVQNLARLNDPRSGVTVAFAQSGLTGEAQSRDLESLGTLFYEPFWLFYRGADPGARLEGLRGKKVSVGPEGSGTRALGAQFLAYEGINERVVQLLPLSAAQSGAALLRRDIDAALMVASWDTPVVRQLLASSDVHVWGFPRADALVALHPFLTRLILPQGAADMVSNRPPTDVSLVAPRASLIVRRDLHPAIQYLLLDAASEIHAVPSIFQKPGQFPAPEEEDLPLSKEARQFYKSGGPLLQRYLPFWLAVFVGRILVLLIPIVAVAFPLLRIVPAIYGWGMRRRIFRLYGELKIIELESETRGDSATEDMLAQLDRLEERADHLRVPRSFATMLYTLRAHIGLVRTRLMDRVR